ncbi:helix-hairpin-helix domain-containing protein [Bradyrhizobium yuanmingense]|uniref:helix-hairpin-helix domain-containing protein n=1 Tax=Bradyrhizobium yuanmingense TaxID=108015 RepID=UPI0023B99176|nr:helix-hairpin-helix domain-containing protein [Bradyrhizobium yuanmingense]MDF0515782.1 helix-hairpin-helix domain-containing protein [Bradyrhizobium yuanmingense]
MPVLDTRAVAGLLREYAQRTALRGGNPYRARAYSRAADSLAALPTRSMCSSPRTGLSRFRASARL